MIRCLSCYAIAAISIAAALLSVERDATHAAPMNRASGDFPAPLAGFSAVVEAEREHRVERQAIAALFASTRPGFISTL